MEIDGTDRIFLFTVVRGLSIKTIILKAAILVHIEGWVTIDEAVLSASCRIGMTILLSFATN